MTKAVIVHGWGKSPDSIWYPWLARELESRGYEVRIPEMPQTDKPEILLWVNALREAVGDADSELLLIGHSIGCQTIMRFLQTLTEGRKVGLCIFIAPWFMLKNLESPVEWEVAREWLETPIPYELIVDKTSQFITIFSDNDPFVQTNNVKAFENKLNAKTRIEHGLGHFDEEALIELPAVLEELDS